MTKKAIAAIALACCASMAGAAGVGYAVQTAPASVVIAQYYGDGGPRYDRRDRPPPRWARERPPPPHPNAMWVPGHWERHRGVDEWVPSHWEHRQRRYPHHPPPPRGHYGR